MNGISLRELDATATIRAAVEARLSARWSDPAGDLDTVLRYAFAETGKLLRPLLVCHSALAVGGRLDRVLPAAVGFECAHVGSLLHDDLLDGDAIRRSRPAVHIAFGAGTAILAGDALSFAWFGSLAECAERGVGDEQIRRAMTIQAHAGMEVCRGVADELELSGHLDSSPARYLNMARRKTAALLSAACRTGAVLADAGHSQEEALATFGEYLGLAFQIRDDLLPYTADASVTGKPADSDLRNCRPTYPVLLAWKNAGPSDREILRQAFSAQGPSDHLAAVTRVAERTGALREAQHAADDFASHARAALDAVPPGCHVEALRMLTAP